MLKRLTVTLPSPLAAELENLRLAERISMSSVAEIALQAFLERQGRDEAAKRLHAAGATLRRPKGSPRRRRPEMDETERLDAVRRYQILDTPADGTYDAVTALAARIFNVPIAIVSIVDEDRIWFKSRHGLEEVQEIPRDPGLCSSAICTDEVYIVESARTDPRTLTNPLVAGGFGLQFYAAAPLTTAQGYRLGTMCILDRTPREMSIVEEQMLETLAGLVMNDLEVRLQAITAVAEERKQRR